MRAILVLLALSQPLHAETCPAPLDQSAAFDGLFDSVRTVGSQLEAEVLSQQMWQLWTQAPDAKAQALLDRGMEKRAGFDFMGALESLDALVAYCPDYAEGWNQRAFASFLARDFPAALADLDRALTLDPAHIGALSGKGLTLIEMGRLAEGQEAIRAAVALHPWLAERALLDEPPGTDL